MTVTVTQAAPREDLSPRVEEMLRQRFALHCENAEAYGTEFAALWRATADHALGGKLVRPRLLLDIHRALAPSADDSATVAAVDIATHIELLHYAFLLHDDVIDGDLTRRKRPNLIGELAASTPATSEEDSLHWARSSAILMGDLMLSAAIMGFARAEVSAHARRRLLDLVEQTILETVAGEHTDVALSHGIIASDVDTVLTMSVYKTATYSFSLPLRAAALLADSSDSAEATLQSVGRHLGLAYQLQDDLLCVFGDHRTHGKDAFSDLREGKETAIIAYARMTSQWDGIELHFGRADLSPTDGAAARDRLRECGSESFVRGLVREHLESADAALREAEGAGLLPAAAGDAIRALASRVGSRSR